MVSKHYRRKNTFASSHQNRSFLPSYFSPLIGEPGFQDDVHISHASLSKEMSDATCYQDENVVAVAWIDAVGVRRVGRSNDLYVVNQEFLTARRHEMKHGRIGKRDALDKDALAVAKYDHVHPRHIERLCGLRRRRCSKLSFRGGLRRCYFD